MLIGYLEFILHVQLTLLNCHHKSSIETQYLLLLPVKTKVLIRNMSPHDSYALKARCILPCVDANFIKCIWRKSPGWSMCLVVDTGGRWSIIRLSLPTKVVMNNVTLSMSIVILIQNYSERQINYYNQLQQAAINFSLMC